MTCKTLTVSLLTLLAITMSCKKSKSTSNVEEEKQEIVNTETLPVKVKGEEVTYATDTTEMKGYIAYNENSDKQHPGVIVIHEWWGHNDYVRKRADMLVELGYTAIAIDMYGDGKQAEHPEDAGKFAGSVVNNLDMALARFHKAMEVLKSHPATDSTKIAAIGYCFGGGIALTMANSGADLDAVAAFHSAVELPVMPNEKLKAKVLVCNGADDPFITDDSVMAFKAKMDSINADYNYIAYEGATHSFTSKDADSLGKKFNLSLAYNKEADEKSWEALQQLLKDAFN
ncbi:MAG: dienelactone hydrolase family protein [Bacteroidota bacterium]